MKKTGLELLGLRNSFDVAGVTPATRWRVNVLRHVYIYNTSQPDNVVLYITSRFCTLVPVTLHS